LKKHIEKVSGCVYWIRMWITWFDLIFGIDLSQGLRLNVWTRAGLLAVITTKVRVDIG
jgi:hypothetical protein